MNVIIGLVGTDLQLQLAGISEHKDVLNVGNVESKLYVDFDGLNMKRYEQIKFEDFKVYIWMYSKFEVLQLWTLKVLNLRTSNLMFNSGGTVTNQYGRCDLRRLIPMICLILFGVGKRSR